MSVRTIGKAARRLRSYFDPWISKNPHAILSHGRHEYYVNRTFSTQEEIRSFLREKEKSHKISTKVEIRPSYLSFGATMENMKGRFGTPSHFIQFEKPFHDYCICFYKQNFLDQKVILQFQFYLNSLVIAGMYFRTIFGEKGKKLILEEIRKKYELDRCIQDMVIEDDQNNRLIIDDSSFISTIYCVPSQQLPERLIK